MLIELSNINNRNKKPLKFIFKYCIDLQKHIMIFFQLYILQFV